MIQKSNIVLTGMSGAGKSTIGVLLAKALGMGFVDTDILIQQHTGKTLQDTIDNEGIDSFLAVERKVVSQLSAHRCVIATGGSVIYSPEAMAALKRSGTIVYLEVPFPELARRLTNITSRGIVMRPGARLSDVFLEREPLYKEYCDILIDCSGQGIEECVAKVIEALSTTPRPQF